MVDLGRTACEAQDEVLQVCDQLYLAHKITENQLLYLRHLVLIREEAVASIYDDFQVGQWRFSYVYKISIYPSYVISEIYFCYCCAIIIYYLFHFPGA